MPGSQPGIGPVSASKTAGAWSTSSSVAESSRSISMPATTISRVARPASPKRNRSPGLGWPGSVTGSGWPSVTSVGRPGSVSTASVRDEASWSRTVTAYSRPASIGAGSSSSSAVTASPPSRTTRSSRPLALPISGASWVTSTRSPRWQARCSASTRRPNRSGRSFLTACRYRPSRKTWSGRVTPGSSICSNRVAGGSPGAGSPKASSPPDCTPSSSTTRSVCAYAPPVSSINRMR